jgi:hypothetical protein
MEIDWWQPAQRPRNIIQPMMGMFSYARIGRSQWGQREPGETIDIPAGQRLMQTLRKDPMQAPTMNAQMFANSGVIF